MLVINSAKDYYNSVKPPVEERIRGWNVGKKQDTEVEYVAVKTKYFIMSYDSGVRLVNV